jgi:hypothetical protein
MFSFLGALVCIFILLCQSGIEKAQISARNRRYKEYRKRHNFNRDRQWELECKHFWELEKMLGVKKDDYAEKRFGKVNLLTLGLTKLAMVKEILEREGYDYEPHYDTFHDREMAAKNLPWYPGGYGQEGSLYKGL